MRNVACILILYSASIVLYGSLELGHDLLHYLAVHHNADIHDHPHHEHHGIKDHGHDHNAALSGIDEERSFPTLITFFLYFQSAQNFDFNNLFSQDPSSGNDLSLTSITSPPPVPPPWLR